MLFVRKMCVVLVLVIFCKSDLEAVGEWPGVSRDQQLGRGGTQSNTRHSPSSTWAT